MNTLRLLLTLFTILYCTTIAGAAVQEAHAGVAFEKACVLEGKIVFTDSLDAPRTPGGGALFVDNNILIAMQRNLIGTKSARTFAGRNRGNLYITGQVRSEFLGSGLGSIVRRGQLLRYGVRTARVADSEIAAVSGMLNRGVSLIDASSFAAARKFGSGLVTGDRALFNSAFRVRCDFSALRFRNFEGNFVPGYNRARTMIQNTTPGVSPHIFTGSPLRR